MKINLLRPQPERHAVFSVHERKPYGMPDGYRIDVVSLDDDMPCACVSESLAQPHGVGTWLCWLPSRGWVGYYLFSCQENSVGPNEEDVRGPYLLSDIAPPSSEELLVAAQAGTLVVRAPQGF